MEKYNFKLGFSLVELMISLITISCIAAAFTPVITKKLKKHDIALSIAQTSEITTKCHKGEAYPFGNGTDGYKCELCTKTYCINCELTCPDTKYADPQSCTCKNCSENKTVVPDGCEDCKKCITCTKDACTKCEAGYFLKGLDNKTYTTCQKCGKTKGRDNHCFDGINELSPEYCDNPPIGLYCKDDKLKSCAASFDINCATCLDTGCTSCGMYYYLDSSTKKCASCIPGCAECTNGTTCKQCVFNAYGYKNGECVPCSSYTSTPNCIKCTTGNTACTECAYGFYLASDKTCKECKSIDEKCLSCQAGKCTLCEDGYYGNSSGVCEECKISNCAKCKEDGKCELCNENYHLKNGECEFNNNADFECSDANFIKIGKLCFTRKNMGDDLSLTIPSTVNVVSAGSYCYAETQKCCWKGKTAVTCDSEENLNGDYNGCNRTVCSWDAAVEICDKFNYAGKKWRLLTKKEANQLTIYTFINHTVGLGNNGLMLCFHEPEKYEGKVAECQYWQPRCMGGSTGAGANRCMPHYVWTGTSEYGSNGDNTFGHKGAYVYGFEGNMWSFAGGNLWHSGAGASVRCVTEMD